MVVFDNLAPGTLARYSGGHDNGPTLCFISDCVDPGYQPMAIGQILSFGGLSRTSAEHGQLFWIFIIRDAALNCHDSECLAAAVEVSATTPVPAALPLFACGFGVLGFVARRLSSAIAANANGHRSGAALQDYSSAS